MTGGAQAGVPAERIERELEEILARPEFQSDEGPWTGFLEALADLFAGLGSPERAARIVWTTWVVLALAVAVLLFVRAWRLRRPPGARRPAALAPDQEAARKKDVEALLSKAREARAAGDLRGALRATWFALVVGLGQRGALAYRDSWTNRELLERGEPDPTVRALLEPALGWIEAKEFGRAPTTEEDLERLDDLCRRALAGSGA